MGSQKLETCPCLVLLEVQAADKAGSQSHFVRLPCYLRHVPTMSLELVLGLVILLISLRLLCRNGWLSAAPSKTQRSKLHVTIACCSDTHGAHRDVRVPDADVLIHAGDFTRFGKIEDAQDFNIWLG